MGVYVFGHRHNITGLKAYRSTAKVFLPRVKCAFFSSRCMHYPIHCTILWMVVCVGGWVCERVVAIRVYTAQRRRGRRPHRLRGASRPGWQLPNARSFSLSVCVRVYVFCVTICDAQRGWVFFFRSIQQHSLAYAYWHTSALLGQGCTFTFTYKYV